MEDAAIVNLYWQRSDRAVAETEQKYGGYCRSIARRLCRSDCDAEECVNDTWLAAWNSMPDKRPAYLGGFLGCLTRHLAIDRLRAAHSEKRGGGETALALDELAEVLPGEGDPAQALEAKELAGAVQRFVNALGEKERLVFLGRYWYLLPIGEIAGRFGWSESKVKSMLHRLRGRLRKELEKEELL